ncbi:vWA domain-containing protein [Pseudonocardia sp. CA-107938]|uniref:vWA domain-containing protein n=1 Tax=Pseudonocardia sp. CA-107938 TaxID=3240021 RepID=UPI003D937EFD
MTLLWPWALLLLLAVPAAVWWYRQQLRARERRRAELAELGLVAAPTAGGRWRQLPAVLLAVGLVLLVAGLARPQARVPEPRREGTVILAFDTSASMTAPDQAPTRLAAAQALARQFVEQQPPTVLVGVVAFSSTGLVTQEATADRALVLAAIDRLTATGGTGMAGGLQAALSTIVGNPVSIGSTATGGIEQQGPDLGFHGSSSIVLLTDGEDTGELDPLELADLLSSTGVKVYPVGLGTADGTVVDIDGFQIATALQERRLRDIADRTDGSYVAGSDPQALAALAKSVDLAWTVQPRRVELTAVAAALGGLALLGALLLSLHRTGRAVA